MIRQLVIATAREAVWLYDSLTNSVLCCARRHYILVGLHINKKQLWIEILYRCKWGKMTRITCTTVKPWENRIFVLFTLNCTLVWVQSASPFAKLSVKSSINPSSLSMRFSMQIYVLFLTISSHIEVCGVAAILIVSSVLQTLANTGLAILLGIVTSIS